MLATVSDRRVQVGAGSTLSYYTADVVSAQDYYPFGMLQPGRSYNAGGYRYGFNGKENDNEVKGEGNQQDYGMRIYDPRIAKFLSVDPLTNEYPWYTPYQFAGNKPIVFIDRDGEEEGSLDNKLRRLEEAFLSNQISEDQYREQRNAMAKGGMIGTVIAADIFTGGIGSKVFGAAYLFGGLEHNRAKTVEGRAAQDKRSREILANAAIGYGGGFILGRLVKGVINVGSKIKETVSKAVTTVAEEVPKPVPPPSPVVVQTVSKSTMRKELAEEFFAAAGKTGEELSNLLKTIDYSKAVKTTVLKEGDFVWRFERINSKGLDRHFFTDAYGADAGATGMGFGDASDYILTKYQVTKPTVVLESTISRTKNKQYFSVELQNNLKNLGAD